MPDADQSSHEESADTATVELPKPTEADVQALEEKLQRLSDELQPGEQKALGRLLMLAAAGNEAAEAQAGDDVQGYLFYLSSLISRSPVYAMSLNRISLKSFGGVLNACGAGTGPGKCTGRQPGF
jgi:hypothetical protein